MRTIAQSCICVNPALPAHTLHTANARLLALRDGIKRSVDDRPNVLSTANALLRQKRTDQQTEKRQGSKWLITPNVRAVEPCNVDLVEPSATEPTLRIYPDLLLGMMRNERVAIGRIWLLCRHLDSDGRGWIHLTDVREQLTDKNSPLRVVGKRRLRQILADGEGKFWERDHLGRLWLYGVARVAAGLGVERLRDRPIALPIAHLTATLATVRAHCYAAFHSGRNDEMGSPISRDTLAEIAGITDRTQRRYDQIAGVESRTCIAIGAPFEQTNHTEAQWQRRGTFKLTDRRGLHGRAGQTYTAWQLPNQYRGCHQQLPAGRQRKLNRQLRQLAEQQTDLVTQRARGNSMSEQGDRRVHGEYQRVFFEDGNGVARTKRHTDAYCLDRATRRCALWIAVK